MFDTIDRMHIHGKQGWYSAYKHNNDFHYPIVLSSGKIMFLHIVERQSEWIIG